MEQKPQGSQAQGPFRVKITPRAQEDLSEISSGVADTILRLMKNKLSRAPDYFGEPLKGTGGMVWKTKPGKYRVLYVIRFNEKEVHVLAIKNRDSVYRPDQLQTLINLAQEILRPGHA